MAGLVPAIHVLANSTRKTWMPATSAGMTKRFRKTTMRATLIQDDRKVSLMRWFKGFLIILTALILLPVLGVIIFDFYVNAQVARFYDTHPMLRAMNDARPATTHGADPWPEMTAVLLQHVPLGSARSDAVRILADEGMDCQPSNAPTPNSLACFLHDRPASVPRWYIEVKFDQDNKVSEGHVLVFKATTP
jgi:hypothetical protein